MFNFSKPKYFHRPDYVFLICVAILVIFGLIILSSASSDLGKLKFNDTYYYLKHQIIYGLTFGIIGFLITSFLYYKNFQKITVLFLISNIILLILVFTPLGTSHDKNASRWIEIGQMSLQPAELLKISFIIYLAAWLSNVKKRRQSFYEGFLPFLAITCLIAVLVFIQPATTTFIIVMISAIIIYFLSGVKLSHIAGIIILGILGISLLIYLTPYRYERIKSYFNKEMTSQTTGYQLDKSLIAIGSGGIFGIGFGKSTDKYTHLPEAIGDSIFAIIAEELGFIGSIFTISIFAILILKGFQIARKSNDRFGYLTAFGFTSIIAIQAFIHIASISGLIPLTGVPLPFISYGGTSLAVFLTMTGIIVNISKYT
ncbi:MAG: FtsW/RodA/SpoVE family cell cycle protein [Patescibacteria group bacterium]